MFFPTSPSRRRHALLGACIFLIAFLFLRHAGYSFEELGSGLREDTGNVRQPEGHGFGYAVEKEDVGETQTGEWRGPATVDIGHEELRQPVSQHEKEEGAKEEEKDAAEVYRAKHDVTRWEKFPWDADFYRKTGIWKIKEDTNGAVAQPYSPYPDYKSAAWRKEWNGEYVPCRGPRGKLLNESSEDIVRAYYLPPGHFPDVAVGDANVTDIDLDVCFDRFHRYGPYGYGQAEQQVVGDWKPPPVQVDWSKVNWGQLQDECLVANQDRYAPAARKPTNLRAEHTRNPPTSAQESNLAPGTHHRTAILIRTWEGYKYKDNDLQAIRALVTESSLLSGGEYQVFLFVNVKDRNVDFLNNSTAREDYLEKFVPKELRSISILWNENMMEDWYPKVGDWQVYWSQFMSLQWFSKTYPQFDFMWNWEVDTRYTGNHYSFFEGVTKFSKQYPRKHMWERNQRYYFPAAHGNYQKWLEATDREIEIGIRQKTVDPVWGPRLYDAQRQNPIGPKPPTPMAEDDFQWGVGEEADLITLLPIWDPRHTNWDYRDKIWNFVPGVVPHFSAEDGADIHYHHPEFINIPRRVYINTVSRFSKTLLRAMHEENLAGRNMQAEMWPATVALHHGLKAVYAPHPIWMDRKWDSGYMDEVFNAKGGKSAQWGLRRDSPYDHEYERNFGGWSWYYNSGFAQVLYRRWLGLVAKDRKGVAEFGGRELEEKGLFVRGPEEEEGGGQGVHVGGYGPMCLPGMILHPVKNTV